MQKSENIVKAINRNVRCSSRKINLLLKNIRGKKADTVIKNLSFARQRVAHDIKKTVQSAVAMQKITINMILIIYTLKKLM